MQAAQAGGNALINFEWEIHRNDYPEQYLAGYGAKGNPYYRTRWHNEKWFTGKGTVVLAQDLQEKRPQVSAQPYQQGRGDEHFASVLGVSLDANSEVMRKAYQYLSSKYQPKREIRTKQDEDVLNAFIAINEAFNYFRVKNEF